MAAKRLVVEHLEDISGNILAEYPDTVRDLIRGRSGIYALYRRGRLYYVGLATDLMRRVKQHLKDRHKNRWDRFSVYLTQHDRHMKELESLILRTANPKGNAAGGKFVRSKNIRQTLQKAMRDADADRRATLLGGVTVQRRRKRKAAKKKGTIALAGLLDRRMQLKGSHRGYEYRASLRKDGTINYDGTAYESPTAAAAAVVKRQINGWSFWHFRNPKGEWVKLSDLRK